MDKYAALAVDVMPVEYIKVFLLYRNIYHVTETLGIVSLDHWSNCLPPVAGTQDPGPFDPTLGQVTVV